jgi:alanine dehydrogenase
LRVRVGVVTEIKPDEYRVALTPAGVRELVNRGHEVLVERGAGLGSAIPDGEYAAQGAIVLPDAESVFAEAELIVKVKEPQPSEVMLLRPEQIVFTYLHLAPNPDLTHGLIESGAACLAYELVTDQRGRLPLLAPMSEVAGKIAAQVGASILERPMGGRGVLLGGVAGVAPAKVMVIGAGVAGTAAAQVTAGFGADTYVLDRSLDRLCEIDSQCPIRCSTIFATALAIECLLPEVDLVIGAVLIRGARAPRVLTREQLKLMRPNAVLVDVAIDQGGCFETSKPTTHSDPTYELDGIVHYCVTNMPGAVPATSTAALTNATLPYVAELADQGLRRAMRADPGLLAGLTSSAAR